MAGRERVRRSGEQRGKIGEGTEEKVEQRGQ